MKSFFKGLDEKEGGVSFYHGLSLSKVGYLCLSSPSTVVVIYAKLKCGIL